MTGKIYYISNTVNDKLYVGKTTYPTIEERFSEHRKDFRRPHCEKRPLYNAMNKYGIEKFSIHLIEEVELDLLEEREKYWIDYYNSYYNGYNATLGGDGKPLYDYDLFIEDYRQGMLIKDIALKYGCDSHTVTKVIRLAGMNGHTNNLNRQKHKIQQLDLQDKVIQEFESQRAAADYLIAQKLSTAKPSSIVTNIGRVLKGERHTAIGFKWKYV